MEKEKIGLLERLAVTAPFRVQWRGQRRSLPSAALLFLITLGAYWPVWVSRVYAGLHARVPRPTRVRPEVAAGLLLVPVANVAIAVYLALDLPRAIRRAQAADREDPVEPEALALFLLAAPFSAIALAIAIGLPFLIVGFLAWPIELPAMLLCQRALNRIREPSPLPSPSGAVQPAGSPRTVDGEVLTSLVLAVAIGAGLLVTLVVSGGGDEQGSSVAVAPAEQVSDIAISPGGLWVTRIDNGTLERFDPRTGRPVGSPIAVGRSPLDVASGYGSIWVANYVSGTVSRINWTSGRAEAPPIGVGRGPFGIAVGDGSVWVANQVERNVVQIDPETNRVKRRISIGRAPRGVAVGEGAVWAAASEANAVYRIDPRSGETTRIPVGRFCQDVAAGGGSVWATLPQENQVVRIDPATRRIAGRPIGVGLGPSTVEFGDGLVWVANSADGTVSRIDPRSATTVGRPTGIGRSIADLAVRGKATWVLRTDGKVRRLEVGAPPGAP